MSLPRFDNWRAATYVALAVLSLVLPPSAAAQAPSANNDVGAAVLRVDSVPWDQIEAQRDSTQLLIIGPALQSDGAWGSLGSSSASAGLEEMPAPAGMGRSLGWLVTVGVVAAFLTFSAIVIASGSGT